MTVMPRKARTPLPPTGVTLGRNEATGVPPPSAWEGRKGIHLGTRKLFFGVSTASKPSVSIRRLERGGGVHKNDEREAN